nr:uncharacterized protein LOC127310481 [Lolium perenne]
MARDCSVRIRSTVVYVAKSRACTEAEGTYKTFVGCSASLAPPFPPQIRYGENPLPRPLRLLHSVSSASSLLQSLLLRAFPSNRRPMEGSSSTARASAATLVKNTGVAEADVVPGGWSRRGAAASGGGLVLTVADEQEHGLGGEIVPDLNVQPMAEDPLLGETSSVRKRKFEEFDDSEDSGHSYISSEVDSGDAVSYNSDASSDNEVSKYYRKFHPSKQVPRDGMREGLVSHVKEVHPKDLRDKANHAAPRKVLEYYGQD